MNKTKKALWLIQASQVKMMVTGLAIGMSSGTASALGATPDGTNINISLLRGGGGGKENITQWEA